MYRGILTALVGSLLVCNMANATTMEPGFEGTTRDGCKVIVDTDGAILVIPPKGSLLAPHGPSNQKGEYLALRIPPTKCTASLDSTDLEKLRKTLLAEYDGASSSRQEAIKKALFKINSSQLGSNTNSYDTSSVTSAIPEG